MRYSGGKHDSSSVDEMSVVSGSGDSFLRPPSLLSLLWCRYRDDDNKLFAVKKVIRLKTTDPGDMRANTWLKIEK